MPRQKPTLAVKTSIQSLMGYPEREDKSSLPGLTPQVGFTRLAAHNDAQLGQARVAVQSIHLRKAFLAKKMDARVISAFTRVFDALLPAHDWLDKPLKSSPMRSRAARHWKRRSIIAAIMNPRCPLCPHCHCPRAGASPAPRTRGRA